MGNVHVYPYLASLWLELSAGPPYDPFESFKQTGPPCSH